MKLNLFVSCFMWFLSGITAAEIKYSNSPQEKSAAAFELILYVIIAVWSLY